MTDYTTSANMGKRPWSCDLEINDILTKHQAAAVDECRLRDFGLEFGLTVNGDSIVNARKENEWTSPK
jgi:hypothetical protein